MVEIEILWLDNNVVIGSLCKTLRNIKWQLWKQKIKGIKNFLESPVEGVNPHRLAEKI